MAMRNDLLPRFIYAILFFLPARIEERKNTIGIIRANAE